METTQGCCMLFWKNPGSSTSQHSSYTATCLPSQPIQIKQMKLCGCCRKSRNKLITDILWITIYGHTCVGRPAKIYIHRLCRDTGYSLEDLLIAMVIRDRWWESQGILCHQQNDEWKYDWIGMIKKLHKLRWKKNK